MAAEQEAKMKFQREKEAAMVSNMWLDTMHKQQLLSFEQMKDEATFVTQFWETLEMESPGKMHKLYKYQELMQQCLDGGGEYNSCRLQSTKAALTSKK